MTTRPRTTRTCSVGGCDRRHYARGWCNKHWQRWRAHGTTDDPRPTAEQRFWEKVDTSGDCWLWLGGRNETNCAEYGTFYYDGKQGYAHRFSYELHHGPIPEGQEVCHHCDVPLCVRPDHLYAATHQQNVDDAVARWRMHFGTRSGSARLTEADVAEIRRRRATGETQAAIAAAFSVGRETVRAIVNRQTWKHVA